MATVTATRGKWRTGPHRNLSRFFFLRPTHDLWPPVLCTSPGKRTMSSTLPTSLRGVHAAACRSSEMSTPNTAAGPA